MNNSSALISSRSSPGSFDATGPIAAAITARTTGNEETAARAIDRVTAALLCIFVGSIPFEAMQVTEASIVDGRNIFTISKLFGYILFAWTLLNAPSYFRFIHPAMPLFLIYLLMGIIADVSVEFFAPISPIIVWLSILQLIVSFFVFSNLFLHRSFRLITIKSFAFFGGISAVMMILGVTHTDLSELDVNLYGRRSAFGVDPNLMAATWAFALVSCGAVVTQLVPSGAVLRIACLALIAPILSAIVQTASRGGIAAACGGILVILIFASIRSNKRMLIVLMTSVSGGLLYWFLVNSDIAFHRVERSIREGDTSSRIEIWKSCLDLFKTRPLIGQGHGTHRYMLARTADMLKPVLATHNTYFTALVSGGILGFVPFIVGWGIIAVQGIKRSLSLEGTAVIAWLATLAATNCTLDYQNDKMQWIILALAAGFASSHRKARGGSRADSRL